MPSVMPVATAASRASFDPKSISVVTVVMPPSPSSVNVTDTSASLSGCASPTVPGSYVSVCTSLDGGCTSRNVPAKPNPFCSLSLRQRHRYRPPTRTSISHTGIDHPAGPRSQRCTSAGSVYALYTSGRAALNDRVTLTSRSLGSVTCAFSIVIGISPFLVASPCLLAPVLSALARASTRTSCVATPPERRRGARSSLPSLRDIARARHSPRQAASPRNGGVAVVHPDRP